MGVGRLDRLLPPQLLQLPGQSPRRAQGLLGGGVFLLPLSPGPLQLPVDLCQAAAPLRALAGEAVLPPLPLFQLLLDAGRILQIVLDAAFQHRDGGLQLPDRGLPALDGKAQPVGLHLFFPHLSRERLRRAKALLHRPLGGLLLTDRLFIVGLQLDAPRPEPLQRIQPHRDLQPLQLVPEDQKPLGPFALLPEGLHLELQLVDLVVDPQQVLVCALQLPFRLLLPVAEAGDPRGLLEHLPAVGGLHRQDLIDAPLSDNGVALPAQAGVHKQLVDVPKTD